MPAPDVVCDASVVLKWFHEEREADVEAARVLLAGHRTGELSVWILDLTFYEIGNVLLRALAWRAKDVARQLDDLRDLCPALMPEASEFRLAARLAEAHELTLYDAVYAATARSRGAMLATADVDLLEAGLGERPGAIATRLGLSGSV